MVRSEDVARQAGVSRATVSLVLNGRTDIHIPESTRQRVLEAARALGYRPHRSGRAIRSGKTGNLALLLSTIAHRSLLSPHLLDGLIDAAAEHDQHLLVSRITDEKLTDATFVPKILREFAADGLVINYNSQTPPRLAELITQAKIPAIWINDKRDADCVFPDDFAAAREATERLIAQGHTRIAYQGHWLGGHYSMADRLAGYQNAMAAHALPEQLGFTEESTAALLYSDHQLRGLRLPQNLAIIVFHNEPHEHFDTFLLPDYQLGIAAVELLMRKIAAPEAPQPALALPLTFHLGGSNAPIS